MLTETKPEFSPGRCDACGLERGPLLKLSLGKDCFGRAYDRLSTASDQSPMSYCETCSMQKDLTRGVRYIFAALGELILGQPCQRGGSELSHRAQVRFS